MTITCPHCNKQFDLERDSADMILHQIRTAEFEKQVAERVAVERKASEAEARVKIMSEYEAERRQYDERISTLKDEVSELGLKIKDAEASAELKAKQVELDTQNKYQGEINDLKLALQVKEQEIGYYKDLKSKMSTKMIGESLEQHCETEFNKIRMAAFPNAYFEKDNEVSRESGSKGDYIFRESDDGTEFISIMFEMKNEADTTSTKKKNEHFFKELDKDRREKKCEYAVLVSLLEPDSEYYNQGIVDVSYQYPKMYVIRPQFFIAMITLLRNMARNTLTSKRELDELKERDLDLSFFEENFDAVKTDILNDQIVAGNKLEDTVSSIDTMIKKLEGMKTAILSSQKYMKRANEKFNSITIENLCADSKSKKSRSKKKAND